MASSSAASSLAAALGSPPAEKLSRENFLYWKMQVLPTLRGAQVMELLEGSDPAPAKTMEVEGSAVANPAYSAWLARDQQVVSFLTKSMNKDLLSHMFGLQHASEIWEAIEALFASESKAKVAMLRAALINTKKRDMSASQFI